ncbi:hypothetical protein [Kribbella lupini]|jgi:hypothetical protein|uniref:Secreted protein n=1 Tax=Kribbella lupini TaxID=291602 RepID=A0ABN2BGL3_9ACTN
MKTRMIARAAAALVATAAIATVTATSASAVNVNWLWETTSGNNIGVGSYTDSGNVMHVDDQEVDDRSVLLFVRRPGAATGYACWDHGGASGGGVDCTLDAYNENETLEGYLCKGEWASNPADRQIRTCNTAQIKRFTK